MWIFNEQKYKAPTEPMIGCLVSWTSWKLLQQYMMQNNNILNCAVITLTKLFNCNHLKPNLFYFFLLYVPYFYDWNDVLVKPAFMFFVLSGNSSMKGSPVMSSPSGNMKMTQSTRQQGLQHILQKMALVNIPMAWCTLLSLHFPPFRKFL